MIHTAEGDIIRQQRRHGAHPPAMLDGELLAMRGDAHVLRDRMHPGVGAAGARHVDGTAQKRLERTTDLPGDRSHIGLLGKSGKPGAIVAQAKHQRAVEHLGFIANRRHGRRFDTCGHTASLIRPVILPKLRERTHCGQRDRKPGPHDEHSTIQGAERARRG